MPDSTASAKARVRCRYKCTALSERDQPAAVSRKSSVRHRESAGVCGLHPAVLPGAKLPAGDDSMAQRCACWWNSAPIVREAVAALVRVLTDLLRPRAKLIAENVLLRQQVVVLRRGSPRPHLKPRDRWSMAAITKIFPALLDAVTVVQPETVIRWHPSLRWLYSPVEA